MFLESLLPGLMGLLGVLIGAHVSSRTQVKVSEAEIRASLQLACADKRFEKHQEAFTLLLGMFRSIHHRESFDASAKVCQEWWNFNGLYLGSRCDPFANAISDAWLYVEIYEQTRRERKHGVRWNEKDVANMQRLFHSVMDMLTDLKKATCLPSLGTSPDPVAGIAEEIRKQSGPSEQEEAQQGDQDRPGSRDK